MKNKKTSVNVEDLLDALDSITWYNTYLAEELVRWKEPGYLGEYKDGMLSFPQEASDRWLENGTYYQFQFFWMMCVLLFGDYGTSPRYGWIEDLDGFNWFIDQITKTHQEHPEE